MHNYIYVKDGTCYFLTKALLTVTTRMEVQTEQEAVCTIALKPKYDLLDPNFEGYKLNLSKIPTHSKQVEPGEHLTGRVNQAYDQGMLT